MAVDAQLEASLQEALAKLAVAEAEAAKANAVAASATSKLAASMKREFMAALRGMAGSASADIARRDALEVQCVPLESFFHGWPPVAAATVAAAWARCRAVLAARAPAESPAEGLPERAFVHAVLLPLLRELTRDGELRLWYEATLADSVPLAEACPDVTWTHVRDASASLLGALVCCEIKRWGLAQLKAATTQAASYTRRIVGRLVREADDRGEALHAICALSVACVGSHVCFVRVRSGAPPDGDFTHAAVAPCPAECTPALPLLDAWDPAQPGALPLEPPAGFAALLRLVHVPAAQLSACTAPLSDAELACGAYAGVLPLPARLGCGGTCDAYAATLPDSGQHVVLKLPRCSSEYNVKAAAVEAAALRALAAAPDADVPRLVDEGVRVLRSRPAAAHAATLPWPVLLLSPVGMPLAPALSAALAAAAPGAPARAARRCLADVVVAGMLRGLRAAHAAGLVHCDVRPANCVLLADGRDAMLVDYGLCRAARDNCWRAGQRAFAAERVWAECGPCAAAAGLDLVGAALTWLAVAYGAGGIGAAPWAARRESVHTWLQRAAAAADADAERGEAEGAALRSLAAHLPQLSAATDTPAPAHFYTWPWPRAEARVTRRSAAQAAAGAASLDAAPAEAGAV